MARNSRHTGRFSSNSKKAAAPEQINSILGSSFASLGLASKIKEHNIKKAWAECVGAGIARRSAPQRLIGTVLHCTVATSAWMTELVYQKSSLISKLNDRLGEKAVTEIIFKIGAVTPYATAKAATPKTPQRDLTPQEKRFIDDTPAGLKDERLKEAIVRAFSRSKS
jgi:hypothetical protein